MTLPDLLLEIQAPVFDWAVIESGGWTGIKLRRAVMEVMDWPRLYAALRRNSDTPAIILRSNTNIPDRAELNNLLATWLFTIRRAGFKRIYLEVCNEPNNEGDWNLDRWLREGPSLVDSWLSLRLTYPGVKLISPAMRPELPSTAAQWHLARFAEFDLLAAHCYYQWQLKPEDTSPFWSPWDLHNLYPDKNIMVTEMNAVAGDYGAPYPERVPCNLVMLKKMASWSYVVGVTFFAIPFWKGFDITVGEAQVYGKWFKNQRGGIMPMTRQDAIAMTVDLWGRHGAMWNPDIGYCQDWLTSFIIGGEGYWGAPEGGEMPSGDYQVMAFAKKRLWWKKGVNVISDGAFPLA